MSRYGNVTILPADPNPWAGALGLIGSIMGKNAADRQGVKDINGVIDSIAPTENPTMQATNPTATTGGLLSGNTTNTPAVQTVPQQTPVAQSAPQTAMPQQQPQQQPVQTAPKTFADTERAYNQGWAQKVKAATAKMSPDAARLYLPQIIAQRDKDLATLKTDWTKQETANNWDLFNNETDPKKKLFLGTKLSLPAESMKMLLEPDTKTQLVNMGGKYVQVGTNAYTGKMINMETGQPLTAEDLQMTMTPGQEATLAETIRHNGVTESKGGGGSATDNKLITNAKYAVDKHTQWVKDHTNKLTGDPPDETQSPYYGYAQQGQKILDSYYGIGGNDNSGGGADYNKGISQVTAALGKGISKDKIIQAVRQDYGDMADVILADSGLIGGEPASNSSGIDLSAPTFGDNGQTLVDYLDSGNAWQDFYNKNRNIGR